MIIKMRKTRYGKDDCLGGTDRAVGIARGLLALCPSCPSFFLIRGSEEADQGIPTMEITTALIK
jgi:hypothetical protein